MKTANLARVAWACILIIFLTANVLFFSGLVIAAEKGEICSCCRMSLQEAADILGVPPGRLQKNSRELVISPENLREKYTGHPCGCSIRMKNSFLKTISYNVYQYRNLEQARREFNRMMENFAVAGEINTVKGLGDDCFRAEAKHLQRLVALQGKVMIDVLSPVDVAAQKKVMRLVLERK